MPFPPKIIIVSPFFFELLHIFRSFLMQFIFEFVFVFDVNNISLSEFLPLVMRNVKNRPLRVFKPICRPVRILSRIQSLPGIRWIRTRVRFRWNGGADNPVRLRKC